jgi:hypothetical protein
MHLLYWLAETMKRQHRFVLIGSTFVFSWLAMQAVHEMGHVIAAAASGGLVEEVLLHPAAISYTRLATNPHPAFVAWMGPIVGVAVPTMALLAARAAKTRGWYVVQFFAAFCLVANGAYLSFGSIGQVGDAGDLLRHGARPLLLWLFGVITIPIGFWLWNGLGSHFGLGQSRRQVDPVVTYVMLALAVGIIMLELIFA